MKENYSSIVHELIAQIYRDGAYAGAKIRGRKPNGAYDHEINHQVANEVTKEKMDQFYTEEIIQKAIKALGNMPAFPGESRGLVNDDTTESGVRDGTLDEFVDNTHIQEYWPKLKERTVRLLLTGNPDGPQ